ncbi:hypothetical protein QBC34DRAFT_444079 [Podospora aff. communis PSN243]|uniref:Uncharacterized protein n=1 Tax=Podospora aff. communis PSN243 TaxID=3040156 RepID=A0AAV9G3F1_9PEZI|nr:hypothetical protein QBC34DRAFT_444079 [Podospora aff. communis PSN243]
MMTMMFYPFVILVSSTWLGLAATLGPRGVDEFVILANCVGSPDGVDTKASHMADFETSPDVKGARVNSVTETAHGHTTLWEENVTSGTFGDGNVFTATIGRPVAQGEFAGTASASPGDFSCWRNHRKGLYIWDAYMCDGIYDCNRKGNTHLALDACHHSLIKILFQLDLRQPDQLATQSGSSGPKDRTPPAPEKDGTTRAAGIGGIIGGIAALLTVLGGIFDCWYKRRKERIRESEKQETPERRSGEDTDTPTTERPAVGVGS